MMATVGQEEPVHFEPVEQILEWVHDLLSARGLLHSQVLRDSLSAFVDLLHLVMMKIHYLGRYHVCSSTLLKLRLAEKFRALHHRLKDSYLFRRLMISSTFRNDQANVVIYMASVQPLEKQGISNWAISFLIFLNGAVHYRHILRASYLQHQLPTRSHATEPSNLVDRDGISRLPPLHRMCIGFDCTVCF